MAYLTEYRYCANCQIIYNQSDLTNHTHYNVGLKITWYLIKTLKKKRLEFYLNRPDLIDENTNMPIERPIKLPEYNDTKACPEKFSLKKNMFNCFDFIVFGETWIQKENTIKKHEPVLLQNESENIVCSKGTDSEDSEEKIPMYNDLDTAIDFSYYLIKQVHHLLCCTDLNTDKKTTLELKKHAREQFIEFREKYSYADHIEEEMLELTDLISHKIAILKKKDRIDNQKRK